MSGRPRHWMQCKDIPDQVFLDAVKVCQSGSGGWFGGGWSFRHYVEAVLSARPELIWGHTPYGALPSKLVIRKAAKLIRRGLMDGCACGCRGDWEVRP